MVLLGRTGRGDGVKEALQCVAGADCTIITMMRCDVGALEDANNAHSSRVSFPACSSHGRLTGLPPRSDCPKDASQCCARE